MAGENENIPGMLMRLGNAIDTLTGVQPTAKVETPMMTRPTNAGTIAAGARTVSVANVGAANGILLGATLKAGETVSISAAYIDTLAAIPYDASGTEFVIVRVV